MEESNPPPIYSTEPLCKVWNQAKKIAQGKSVRFQHIVEAVKIVPPKGSEKEVQKNKEVEIINSVVEALIVGADSSPQNFKPLAEFAEKIVDSSEFCRMFHYNERLALRNAASLLTDGELTFWQEAINCVKEFGNSVKRLFNPIGTADEYNEVLLEKKVKFLEYQKLQPEEITEEIIETFNPIKAVPGQELTEIDEKLNEQLEEMRVALQIQRFATPISPHQVCEEKDKARCKVLFSSSSIETLKEAFGEEGGPQGHYERAVNLAIKLLPQVTQKFEDLKKLADYPSIVNVDEEMQRRLREVQELEIAINQDISKIARMAERKIRSKNEVSILLGRGYLEVASKGQEIAEKLHRASESARVELQKIVRTFSYERKETFDSFLLPSQWDPVCRERLNAHVAFENAEKLLRDVEHSKT